MALSLFLTAAHLLWMFYWGRTYTRIRKARKYAQGRALADTNRRYKWISYATFFTHNGIALAAYWSNAVWLLKIEESPVSRIAGVVLLILGTWLHSSALQHLGRNYSPCFDSHLPFELVTSGPYQKIRHPDYLAKLIVSLALFLMTGSLWVFAMFAWLTVEVMRSVAIEERKLPQVLAGYSEYQKRTAKMIPGLF